MKCSIEERKHYINYFCLVKPFFRGQKVERVFTSSRGCTETTIPRNIPTVDLTSLQNKPAKVCNNIYLFPAAADVDGTGSGSTAESAEMGASAELYNDKPLFKIEVKVRRPRIIVKKYH